MHLKAQAEGDRKTNTLKAQVKGLLLLEGLIYDRSPDWGKDGKNGCFTSALRPCRSRQVPGCLPREGDFEARALAPLRSPRVAH